jgi:hypothetical protein
MYKLKQTNEITFENMPQAVSKVQDDVSVIKTKLDEICKNFKPKEAEEFLTRTDVALMLKVNFSTLWNWQKKGKLIPLGIGGRVYYKRSDIEAMLIPLGKTKLGNDV